MSEDIKTEEESKPVETVVEPKAEPKKKPKGKKVVPYPKDGNVEISLGDFLSNDDLVRKSSNYLPIGFQRMVKLKKIKFRQKKSDWQEMYKNFISGGKN